MRSLLRICLPLIEYIALDVGTIRATLDTMKNTATSDEQDVLCQILCSDRLNCTVVRKALRYASCTAAELASFIRTYALPMSLDASSSSYTGETSELRAVLDATVQS